MLNAQEVGGAPADLIVFPEGACHKEIQEASTKNPNSIIVGAIVEDGRSRGLLIHHGQNKIEYLKVESDDRTEGSQNVQQCPVYEMPDICIGVLICKDIDSVEFARKVIDRIKSSSCALKLLCVPADMMSDWFSDEKLPPKYEGVHVVLCNHTKTYQFRCQSFVTDMLGNKINVQKQHKPVYAQLPS